MLRRLIACLALLTGLVAVGAPAHANLAAAIEAQLELAQKVDDGERADNAACVERQRQMRQRPVKTTSCRQSDPVVIYLPTVQFGPDRAFE